MNNSLRIRLSAVALGVVLPFAATKCQAPDSTCGYTRCALSIAPRLSGLDVVRGDAEQRIASLAFLWPRDVTHAFEADPVATRFAARASSRRRWAAVMTDAGAAIMAVGLLSIERKDQRVRREPGLIAASGAVLVAASVPIHFAADADLARAVWRYNLRFSR